MNSDQFRGGVRSTLFSGFAGLALVLMWAGTARSDPPSPQDHASQEGPSAREALARLVEGNRRFVEIKSKHPHEPDDIVSLLYRIEPALHGLSETMDPVKRLEEAVKRNVQLAVKRLSETPDLKKAICAERLKIVGGVYDLHTGRVEFLKEADSSTGAAAA